MAYNEFAYFYDELNSEADYDRLFEAVHSQLKSHGIREGIVADLGCGTGDLTLMLAQAGYDMIAIDQSQEMLSVLRDKAEQLDAREGLLLLNQDLLALDLYGTIQAAVSTFDTYNHIGPYDRFDTAIRNAAFFMEKGGVFLFDMNTPYKHKHILGDNAFSIEAEDAVCNWQNRYDSAEDKVEMTISIHYLDTDEIYTEQFCEYSYTLEQVKASLERHGFVLESVCDGESFHELKPDSQRMFFVAVKQFTQEEGN